MKLQRPGQGVRYQRLSHFGEAYDSVGRFIESETVSYLAGMTLATTTGHATTWPGRGQVGFRLRCVVTGG